MFVQQFLISIFWNGNSQFDTEPRWKEIVKYEGSDKPFIEKGFLTVSNKPGIGVEINEEGLKKYAARDVPFFA